MAENAQARPGSRDRASEKQSDFCLLPELPGVRPMNDGLLLLC
jgi:hypothetical protein